MTTIIASVVSGLCVAIPNIIANILTNKRNNDLVIYRINELDEKVHAHNNLVNRMYEAEKSIDIINEKIKKH